MNMSLKRCRESLPSVSGRTSILFPRKRILALALASGKRLGKMEKKEPFQE
jgi:hypothetical protein